MKAIIFQPIFRQSYLVLLFWVAIGSSTLLQAQYNQPNVSFTTNGGCVNNAINFIPNISGLVYNSQTQDSITLAIWDFGDGIIDTIFNLPDTTHIPANTHTYTSSGIFYPSLKIINRDLLDSTYIHRLVVSPTATPTITTPYFENFDTPYDWFQEEATENNNDSLWQWGIATGLNINTSQVGNNVWGTRLSATYGENEDAWVYSPCFDLTNLDAPMLSMSIWRNMLTNIDGVVLEYYEETNQTWEALGEPNMGVNWYQSNFILARPGGQELVTYPKGWTGNSMGWESARYRLDNPSSDLSNKTNVRFRVAFASAQGTLLGVNDGFAFDSVFVGNRTKKVLVEHFDNVYYVTQGGDNSDIVDQSVYNKVFAPTYSSEVALIQYQTNFSSPLDPINIQNSLDPASRAYYYAINEDNQFVMNGGVMGIGKSVDLDTKDLDVQLLQRPQFLIDISTPIIFNNTINVSSTITSLEGYTGTDLVVHTIIVQDSFTVNHRGFNMLSVCRKMLPNGAGASYPFPLGQGGTVANNYSWDFSSEIGHASFNPNQLKVVVYVQNITTKEVYQVNTSDAVYFGLNSVDTAVNIPSNLGLVYGTVAIDTNTNCAVDSLELGIGGMLVQFINGVDTFYTTTDSQGFYYTILDTGAYTISIINNSPYFVVCPASQQVYLNSTQPTNQLNWALRATIECPYLTVDIAAPFLRTTNNGSDYTVYYCNQGTVAAQNAYVEVDMDIDLTILGSSIPIANQNGQVYTFNIGTVGVGQCGSFTIQVVVDTSSYSGQTHCTEAHIFPDTICVQPIWAGAIINTQASCISDSIEFVIQNTGAAMNAIRHYYVVEDNIMMRVDPFQLGSGQATSIRVEAQPGSTYRILAEQEVGYPAFLGDSVATSVLEACVLRPDGSFNTGFVTQFSNGNSSPFIAVDCQQNIGSFDPNDKAAQPEGYDATHHYIYHHNALDYKVRFQNTGSDTAFNIVITDMIDPALDLSTLEMGASSHPYTWRVYGQGILEVTFSNIMLPDSNVNELLSHGFFRYRIQQKVNNPIGTVINNTASIYFDFNAPVITNTTWHTVGENFVITVAVDKIANKALEVLVYPNPFNQNAMLEIKGEEFKELTLTIFDATGREVAQERGYNTNQLQLHRGKLQGGVYFYQLESNGTWISSGKLIVQ